MQVISISEARKNLPELVNKVYLSAKPLTITKGGIPMAKLVKINEPTQKHTIKTSNIKKAIKLAGQIKGVWNEEWKDKTTEEVANLLAEKAWNSHAH